MFRMSSKRASRAIMLIMVLCLAFIPAMTAFAADTRPTGPNYINTDGSTTVFPILQLAQYQFPAYLPAYSSYIVQNDNPPGSGSGHGIQSLANQMLIQSTNSGGNAPIDLAISSRNWKSGDDTTTVTNAFFQEAAYTTGTGAVAVPASAVTGVPVAMDALTILVNVAKYNCITGATQTGPHGITKAMIQAIYSGSLLTAPTTPTNPLTQHTWNEFWPGCGAENIVPVARVTSSGTRSSFLDFTTLTSGQESAEITAAGSTRQTGNPQVEADIAANASHMGYTGLAFADNVNTRQLPLDWADGSGLVTPSEATTINCSYGMSRPLFVYYKTSGVKQGVLDLVSFLNTRWGQGNVENVGFVSIQKVTTACVTKWSPYLNTITAAAPALFWDVNADGTGNVLDITSIGNVFGQTGPASGDPNFPNVRGWVRADVNFDANVNVLDITTFGPHFGQSY